MSRRSPASFVTGLFGGMAATARVALRPTITQEYPDVQPDLPPRSRGVIALIEENCTSCMLCARECPDWCIYIDSHKETIPATTPGGRERQRNVLDRFAIDFSLCMYCSICIEVCPFDALHWSPVFELAELDIKDLLHEKDRLAKWAQTIPPPQVLDPAAPDAAELTASRKPPRAARPAPGGDAGTPGAAERPARPERPARAPRAEGAERPARAPRAEGERPARTPRVAPPAPAEAPAGAVNDPPAAPATTELPAAPATTELPAETATTELPAAPATTELPAAPAEPEAQS